MPLGEYLRQVLHGSPEKEEKHQEITYAYRFLIADLNRRDELDNAATQQERDARTERVAQRALNLAKIARKSFGQPSEIILDDLTSNRLSYDTEQGKVFKYGTLEEVSDLEWAAETRRVMDLAMGVLPVGLRDVLYYTFKTSEPELT